MKGKILQAGAPVLRQKAKPVLKKDFGSPALRKTIEKMRKAMADYGEYGVAIAAPQIGASLRVFIVSAKAFRYMDKDSGQDQGEGAYQDMVFVNPELVRLSRKKNPEHEGCMSVHGTFGVVMRHEKASVKAHDESGKPFLYHGSGLLAHIFQHEVDHLEGILFIDKAESLNEEKIG